MVPFDDYQLVEQRAGERRRAAALVREARRLRPATRRARAGAWWSERLRASTAARLRRLALRLDGCDGVARARLASQPKAGR